MNLNENSYKALSDLKKRKNISTVDFTFPDGKKATILDFGVNVISSDEETALKVAEATMGGLGKVTIAKNKIHVEIPENVAIATLGCQLAGWSISIQGKNALGSGPARILAKKPKEFLEKLGYEENSKRATLILETDSLPEQDVCENILKATNADELLIAAFKGNSYVGLVNIMARVVELSVFRLNTLGYDIKKINYGRGEAPIPILNSDAMSNANDALIYSSFVFLETDGWDFNLTEKIVSLSSKAYGKKFSQIFKDCGGDFYKIPKDIFSPAKVKIVDIKKNKEYVAGKIR